MAEKDEKKRDYPVTANPVSWGLITAVIFFYDHRPKANKKFPLKIRLTYNRERMYINTGFSVSIEEWNNLMIAGRGELKKMRDAIQAQMTVIKGHVEEITAKGTFTFEQLNSRLGRGKSNDAFNAFEKKIKDTRKAGRVGNAMIYECALNSLKAHVKRQELPLSKITPSWLQRYDEAMKTTGLKTATRSIYMRCLRAILNAAGVPSPFGKDKYQIKGGEGRKMALTRQQINNTLMKYPVLPGSTTDKMRDLFYFSYLTNGINIKDLVLLRWSDIKNNEIQFVREKTARTGSRERTIAAPILPQVQQIIDKWGDRDSKYIFGYVDSRMTQQDIRLVSQNVTRLINKHLDKIAKAAGLPKISTYTARHSYAQNLLRSGAPIAYISSQLGHRDISTTQAYLSGFDNDDMVKFNTALTEE